MDNTGIIISPGRQVTVGPTSVVRVGDLFVSFEDAAMLVSAILLAIPKKDPADAALAAPSRDPVLDVIAAVKRQASLPDREHDIIPA